jgi:hypothetical protein
MRIAAVALVALMVSGCSSAGLVASNPGYGGSDQRTCARYGFAPKTDAFAQCMLQLDQRRSARDEDARERRGEALLGFLTGL